jgi:hypothetical protein
MAANGSLPPPVLTCPASVSAGWVPAAWPPRRAAVPEPFGIVPAVGFDQHLRFGAPIRGRVRHRFDMGAA